MSTEDDRFYDAVDRSYDRGFEAGREQAADAIAELVAENERLKETLARYRKEVPLGHQPHMLAHEVDAMLALPRP